jgi:hypothetical protein
MFSATQTPSLSIFAVFSITNTHETIWFGANDSNPEPRSNQTVLIPAFIDNLKKIMKSPLVTAHPDLNIILLTLPPVEESILTANMSLSHYVRDCFPSRGIGDV